MNPVTSASMKFRAGLIVLLAIACVSTASAQVTWQTTQTTNNTQDVGTATLNAGTLRVKVFPAYLDVEEDVEVAVTGTVRPQNDPTTLEILGIFTLPPGAVITGALLWEGTRVLQAKLLDEAKADSIYEELVDRDSIPPARPIDPLILERTAANTYKVSVYPVIRGYSRHFRLRYQLPPKMGVDGFEIRLQGALIPLFSAMNTVSTTLESAGGTTTVGFVENGLKREMTLPRTVFLSRASLTTAAAAGANAIRVMPVNPQRLVQVKTSFGTGTYAGNYLNFYAGVDEALLRSLGQRIEVVFFWKWHNPGEWKFSSSYIAEAQSQAAALLAVYGQLGLPGNRVGLLHDDSRNALRAFPVASQTESGYQQAVDYLKSVQGSYVQDFVNNILFSGSNAVSSPSTSKSRFLSNMQVVKTLYSPDEGVVRHLVLVSAGPEYIKTDTDVNAAFDSLFRDKPVSLSALKGRTFTQVGFDFIAARQAHSIPGTLVSTAQADLPGFPAMTLLATVRNTQKAYDFGLTCTGGLSVSCGTLEFHGKSPNPWEDSVEWGAYHPNGQLLGKLKQRPAVYAGAQDTGTVLLWAGSSASPFSEGKEHYLGPVYGFVDLNASLLALPRDSITNGEAYGDTGVPYAGPIPDYLGPGYGTPPFTAVNGKAGNAAAWRLERAGDGVLRVRIPGLAPGERVELILTSLDGKRAGRWTLTANAGFIQWRPGVRAGNYLMTIRGPRTTGEKLILIP